MGSNTTGSNATTAECWPVFLSGWIVVTAFVIITCFCRNQNKKNPTETPEGSDTDNNPNKASNDSECSSAKSNQAIDVYIQTQNPFNEDIYKDIKAFLKRKGITCTRPENLNDADIKKQPVLYVRYTTGRIENDITACISREDDIQRKIVLLLSNGQEHGEEIDPSNVHFRENPNSAFKNLYGIVRVNVDCIVEQCDKCDEALDKLCTKISTINEKMPVVSEV